MIVSLHVATGAVAGALSGRRRAALALGALTHLAADRVPHRDIRSVRFEALSGGALLLFLAAGRGPLSPAVVGALAASAPDLEHVLTLPRPGGRKLFPSHRVRGWHRSGGAPASLQLLAAGVLAGLLVRRPW